MFSLCCFLLMKGQNICGNPSIQNIAISFVLTFHMKQSLKFLILSHFVVNAILRIKLQNVQMFKIEDWWFT